MYVHGYGQADGRFYLNDHGTANDTFLLRRVRPIIEGTVYKIFDYRVMTDFGSGRASSSSAENNMLLDDAYVNARLWPQFQIQAGKFKSPIGLERLQSVSEPLFIETGFATQLTPNYDAGVQIRNSLFNAPVNYAIGVVNGAADAVSDDQDVTDESKDFVGRLFFQPFLRTDVTALQKLGFGISGSIGSHQGALPSYKTAGQQTFFSYTNGVTADGPQYRFDPQMYYYWGRFGILGEYIFSSPEVTSTNQLAGRRRFHNRAWQVEASWFITGDENSFRYTSTKPFFPAHSFRPGSEGWGAVEFVARVEQMSLDDKIFPKFASKTSAQEETSWGVGLNWYLNSNIRFYLDYESTWFKAGVKGKGSVTATDEQVVLGRVQFAF
jgi:phosphate-selective porin OprO/OprP